jgi:hypothetical protein
METKLQKLFTLPSWDILGLDSIGNSGGILMGWNPFELSVQNS